MSHTSGPWHVVEDGENCPYVQRRIRTLSNAEAPPIAWEVHNEADARLIAAAPELLKACKTALALCPDELAQSNLEFAIRKAEGEL